MILADITLTDVLWSMLVFFFFFIWIMILFQVFIDLFRDHEESGVVKAIWVICLIFFTPITVLVYLIVRGKGMAMRSQAQQQAAQADFANYVQSVSAAGSPADQIAKAKELLDAGTITQAEFDSIKAKALA
ncbi:MAG: SHOCT domain-containing protein [Acidimicrobiales bacterium]